MKKFILLILILIAIAGVLFVFAGSLTAPTPAPEPTFYTLEDIYNLIHNNTSATEGNHSLAPSVPTTSTSSYSISQLYADLANLIKRENLETNYQVLGVTGNYDNPDPDYATTTVIASSLTRSTPIPDTFGYSLNDICNLINDNLTTPPANRSLTPDSSPTIGTQCTLTDIYTSLANLIDPTKVKEGVTYLGQEGTYDHYEGYFVFEVTTTGDEQAFAFKVYDAVDLYVDWGDGSEPETFTLIEDGPTDFNGNHNYSSAGIYAVRVQGGASRICFGGQSGPFNCDMMFDGTPTLLSDILTPISQGMTGITSTEGMFAQNTATSFTASDFFDEISTNVTSLKGMFHGSNFNGDVSNWDTSNVIDMEGLFSGSDFNSDLSGWNISSVTNMDHMFNGATSFNQDLSGWDVSNVTSMNSMFSSATSFNQNLSLWNVANVTEYLAFDNGATAWDLAFRPVFGP